MKKLLLAMINTAMLIPAFRAEASEPRYRYAYSCDGYNQDRDDVAASAMVIALIDRAGRAKDLVHFHFNTNFGGAPTHVVEHRKSALQTAALFGLIKEENDEGDAFFDIARSAQEKQSAIDHLAERMRASTASEPLMMICAGGVQVPYAALELAIQQGAGATALKSLVFFSHSKGNENIHKKDPNFPEYAPNWANLKTLSPTSTFIDHASPRSNEKRGGGVMPSQNSTAWNQALRDNGRKGVAEWQWLKAYGEKVEGFGFSGTKGQWLLTRLKAAGAPEIGHNANAEGDASDAGMVFAQFPGGRTDATMEEIRDYFLEKKPLESERLPGAPD